jgi:hypothetical protein
MELDVPTEQLVFEDEVVDHPGTLLGLLDFGKKQFRHFARIGLHFHHYVDKVNPAKAVQLGYCYPYTIAINAGNNLTQPQRLSPLATS